jgi:poly(beta-D-mannuronate) lyase
MNPGSKILSTISLSAPILAATIALTLSCTAALAQPGTTAPDRKSLSPPFPLASASGPNNGKTTCTLTFPAPVTTLDLSSIYEDGDATHSTIDPNHKSRYDAALKATRDFGSFVARQASTYTQSNGRRLDAAACALMAMESWAKGHALSDLKTRQSHLSATRIIAGTAMAYLQVRAAATALNLDTATIDTWLTGLAENTIPVYTDGKNRTSDRQNHRYWGGYAVAAVGVAVDRPDFLRFGMESYDLGINQVTADGALPLEVARAKKARDYHLVAVAPLVMLASLGQANGYHPLVENNEALKRLVHFTLASLDDPTRIEALAGARQLDFPRATDGLIRGDRVAWLAAYLALVPSDRETFAKLAARPLSSANLGGRTTMLYTRRDTH